MCGIVGVAGIITQSLEKTFENMLVADAVRGRHSTGAVFVEKTNSAVTTIKRVGGPTDLLDSRAYDQGTRALLSVMIGHNRYATIGRINSDNAHPFEFSNVVGVHNGTLTKRTNLHNQNLYDTDSESLYSHINEYGIVDAIDNTDGAWALVWWDKGKKELNFLRNTQRPMYIAILEDTNSIAWASEKLMLEWCLSRNNVKVKDVVELATNTWLRFGIDNGIMGKPHTQVIMPKVWPNTNKTNYYYPPTTTKYTPPKTRNLVGQTERCFEVTGQVSNGLGLFYLTCEIVGQDLEDQKCRLYLKETEAKKMGLVKGTFITGRIISYCTGSNGADSYNIINNSSVEVVEWQSEEPRFLAASGELVDKATWEKMHGQCSWCTSDIEADEEGVVITKEGEVFCPSCVKDTDVKDFIKNPISVAA